MTYIIYYVTTHNNVYYTMFYSFALSYNGIIYGCIILCTIMVLCIGCIILCCIMSPCPPRGSPPRARGASRTFRHHAHSTCQYVILWYMML